MASYLGVRNAHSIYLEYAEIIERERREGEDRARQQKGCYGRGLSEWTVEH